MYYFYIMVTTTEILIEGFESILTTKYLYFTNFYGAFQYGMRTNKFSYKHLEEAIEAFKISICNVFHGGCEPEFDTEEQVEKWNNFNKNSFLLVTEDELKQYFFDFRTYGGWSSLEDVKLKRYDVESPYNNKNIPYYIGVDDNYGGTALSLAKWKAWKYSKATKKFQI